MKKRGEMQFEKWLTALERVMLKHDDWELAPEMWNEDYDRLSSLMSFAATYVDDIPSVQDFVDVKNSGRGGVPERSNVDNKIKPLSPKEKEICLCGEWTWRHWKDS